MSNIASNELETMKRLMGLTESTSDSNRGNKPIIEFTQKGADGKNYAVARVCNKHYIMEAPVKNGEVLAEDYEYVGGFDNRKAYDSYTIAYNQFGLKMKSLNEAYSNKGTMITESVKPAEWMVDETVEMRNAINRINQISRNVDIILEGDERKGVGFGKVGDSAPFNEKAGKFTEELAPEKAGASRDTDWTNDDESVSKKIENTNDEVGSSHASDAAGKHTTGYTQKAPKGKDLKEGRTIKLTEEQVLAWNRGDDNYMDKSHGTEIGDTAPYNEKACACSKKECSDGVVCEGEDWGSEGVPAYPKASVGEVGHNGDPHDDVLTKETNLDESIFEDGDMDFNIDLGDEYTGSDDTSGPMPTEDNPDMDDVRSGNAPFAGSDEEFDDFANNELASGNDPATDEFGFDGGQYADDEKDTEYEFDVDPTDDPQAMLEGLIRESILNDFGKHPAYRKEPFSLPSTNEPAKKEWARRWDNESNLNNEEFGKQIGHNGDPFTEKVVDMLTNTIMVQLGEKKK